MLQVDVTILDFIVLKPSSIAIAKVLYSYVGWNAVLALMAEVKGRNPVRTIQRAGVASLLITATLFVTTIVSFSLVLTKEEMMEADEVLGALFIRKVYGDRAATKLFPIFIGISAFGGIVSMVCLIITQLHLTLIACRQCIMEEC